MGQDVECRAVGVRLARLHLGGQVIDKQVALRTVKEAGVLVQICLHLGQCGLILGIRAGGIGDGVAHALQTIVCSEEFVEGLALQCIHTVQVGVDQAGRRHHVVVVFMLGFDYARDKLLEVILLHCALVFSLDQRIHQAVAAVPRGVLVFAQRLVIGHL